MPPKEECLFLWTTTKGLLLKQLFLAVREIVTEARLIVRSDQITLVNQQDVFGKMVVHFQLFTQQLKDCGEYHVAEDSMMIPLDIDKLAQVVFPIRTQDVVGLCVTRTSCRAYTPTLDVYVMKAKTNTLCCITKIDWIFGEFMRFGPTCFPMGYPVHAVHLDTNEFKRMLKIGRAASLFQLQLVFAPEYTEFAPCSNDPLRKQPEMKFRIRQENANHLQTCEVSDKYRIEFCQRTTKASPMSESVLIEFAPHFALMIQYAIDTWGTLTYRVFKE